MTVILTALLAATTLYAAEKTEKEQANKQTVTLIGEVYDSFTKGKVKAFVTLMDTDSTVVDTVTCETMDTRTWSYFTIKVPRVDTWARATTYCCISGAHGLAVRAKS